MLQTFFNLDIIAAAWRIILAGLGNTVLLSLVVVPLGLLGGLILSLLSAAGVRGESEVECAVRVQPGQCGCARSTLRHWARPK